jgi:hypothetical protein
MNIPENLSKWQIGVFWLEGIKSAMSVAGFCPTCHKLRMADRGPDQKSRPDACPMERSKDSAGFAASNTLRRGPALPHWWQRLFA